MPEPVYTLFATAFGYAGLWYQPAPFILKRIYLPQPDEESLRFRIGVPVRITADPDLPARQAADMICAYFAGERITTPWKWLDMTQFSPAQTQVYQRVARIPYGGKCAYGQIARDVGRKGAARFVGNCMAGNPYPVLIPCHRVVRSNGALGGFDGGLALKRRMLDLEAGN